MVEPKYLEDVNSELQDMKTVIFFTFYSVVGTKKQDFKRKLRNVRYIVTIKKKYTFPGGGKII